jgi:segregation and condensation protein A
MGQVLSQLTPESFTEFANLFDLEEGRRGVVVTFLAVLELMKASLIELVQNEVYGPIYVKAKQ